MRAVNRVAGGSNQNVGFSRPDGRYQPILVYHHHMRVL